MRTVIVEDEQIATQNLQRLLKETNPDIEVVRVLQSVEESIEYFSRNNDIQLVFMDIHLADGLAFHIFDKVVIDCPIIFITAYDKYALEAFKVNSVDYLLKPISKEDLTRALDKCKRLSTQNSKSTNISSEQLTLLIDQIKQKNYKSHLLIPLREKLIPLDVNDIAYIYLDEKISRIVTYDGESHYLDKPLDYVYTQLDPAHFFRANRQYVIAHKAIESISLWPLSKLYITLKVETPDKIIISRARVTEFKDWYTE